MKRTLTLLIVFTLMLFKVSAQYPPSSLAGRKMLSGSFGIDNMPMSDTNYFGKGFSSTTDFSIGKIKEDNTYWAYGGSISYNNINITSSNISSNIKLYIVGASVSYGKLIPLLPNLYLAPAITGQILGTFTNDTHTNDTQIYFMAIRGYPIRAMYQLSNRFMVSYSYGSAGLNMFKLDEYFKMSFSTSITGNSSLGVVYLFK